MNKHYGASLTRIGKVCKAAYYAMSVLYIIVFVAWVLLFLASLISILLPDSNFLGLHVDIISLLAVFVFGAIAVLLLRTARLIFKDIAKGNSPFTLKQGKRIRKISYLMFAQVLCEIFLPASITPLFMQDNMMIGYEIANDSVPVININMEVLIFAIIFYCLSLVFQYGVLLQQDSDGIL